MPTFELTTSVSRNRHSNHVTNMLFLCTHKEVICNIMTFGVISNWHMLGFIYLCRDFISISQVIYHQTYISDKMQRIDLCLWKLYIVMGSNEFLWHVLSSWIFAMEELLEDLCSLCDHFFVWLLIRLCVTDVFINSSVVRYFLGFWLSFDRKTFSCFVFLIWVYSSSRFLVHSIY